ncbi:MAG: DNA ligase [Lachnospiraceae bacterium]
MSKMSELSMVIDEMINCGEGMIKAAKQLKEIFSTEDIPESKAEAKTNQKALPVIEKQSEIKTYSKEEVRGILSGKSASGYGKEVKALLLKYGADKLSALKPENYVAVVADAEVIGNG